MIPACPHWSDCNVTGGGCCAIALHGGRPSLGVCNQCVHNAKRGQWKPVSDPVQVRVPTEEEKATAQSRRDAITSGLWREIHTLAAAGQLADAKLDGILKRLPCGSCLTDFIPLRAADPLSADSQLETTWRWHQAVNAKLGKPGITLEQARELYRGGSGG